jgi:hypothetical protein
MVDLTVGWLVLDGKVPVTDGDKRLYLPEWQCDYLTRSMDDAIR